ACGMPNRLAALAQIKIREARIRCRSSPSVTGLAFALLRSVPFLRRQRQRRYSSRLDTAQHQALVLFRNPWGSAPPETALIDHEQADQCRGLATVAAAGGREAQKGPWRDRARQRRAQVRTGRW